MPRIDPDRLLKCLQPLLDPITGAIRSNDEVDKILGLMSKFSKKLVSKCIYINILRSTHQHQPPVVIDQFMERGGWNLIYGWTNDAIANKNYPLLKEIFELLLLTPVSIPRLKSNRFPILIKTYSKDCEDDETREICKRVVNRWISIAKTEDKTEHHQAQPSAIQQQQQQQLIQSVANDSLPATSGIIVSNANSGSVIVSSDNSYSMNADQLLNSIDPTGMAMLPDSDPGHQSLMDLDLTQSELAGIDINMDILNELSKTVAFDDSLLGPTQQQQQQQPHPELIQQQQQTAQPISVIQHASQVPSSHQLQFQQIMQQIPPQPQQHHNLILEQQNQQLITVPIHQHPQVIQATQQQQSQVLHTSSGVVLTNITAAPHPVTTAAMQLQQHHQQPPQQIQIVHQAPPPQQLQPQQPVMQVQQAKDDSQTISLVQVQSPQKLIIKSSGGQRSVVQNFGGDQGQYCLMVKDGKNYLVRLKEPMPPGGVQLVQQQQQQPAVAPVPPLVSNDAPDSGAPDKTINVKKMKKSPKKDPQLVNPVNKVPGEIQKNYSKVKSSSSSLKEGSSTKDKKVGESGGKKEKDHHHKDSKEGKEKSKSSSGDHQRKSKKEALADKAAQAAREAKQEEMLKEKIRKEKALMKKRQKEMDKQKQISEKDQETLKKLNLAHVTSGSSSSSSGGSLKIPKIPKRNSSFADAIGIPGTEGNSSSDKLKKVSGSSSSEKGKEKDKKEEEQASSEKKKFYGKKEEEAKAEEEKPKERKHKVKVFVSSKSRSDDLLRDMTETKNKAKEKDKETKDKESKGSSVVSNLGNSIPATPPKGVSKRLSTDSLEKPGDVKKPKLDGKEKKKEEEKEKKKSKVPQIQLKESSLFMDAICVPDTPKNAKKKRRISSGDSKEAPKVADQVSSPLVDEVMTTPTEKPVFNFYRDTLNDEDEDKSENTPSGAGANKEDAGEAEKMDNDDDPAAGSFTPQENDGKVKSALVLVRPKNRPKKNVRWREEDELREFHFFEMDETERVNVTKQKDFTELSSNEKAMERSFIRAKAQEQEQENKPWKLTKIIFTRTLLQPVIISTEKDVQDEREKNVLGLFLPPGSTLPEAPQEPDPALVPLAERPEPKVIPVEDVSGITKECDFRTHSWPDPKGVPANQLGFTPQIGRTHYGQGNFGGAMNVAAPALGMPGQAFLPGIGQFPPQMVPNAQVSPQQATGGNQDFNPWGSGLGSFNVPPPVGVPPPIQNPDLAGFGGPFAGQAATLGMTNFVGQANPQAMGFAPNPFTFPPPTPMMNGLPSQQQQQNMDFGAGGAAVAGRGAGGRAGPSRFDNSSNNNNDRRNNFGRDSGRDRERGGNRDRDYRDDRSGRDRDYRSRGSSDRDYRNHHDNRDNRSSSRDYRSGSSTSNSTSSGSRNIRKEIPCRFFKKGHCSNGSRCEFLHEGGSSSSSHSDKTDSSSSSSRRRSPSDSTTSPRNTDEDWDATPASSNTIPDSAQSPPQEDQQVHQNHQPPRTTSRFSDAPLSPTDDSPMSPVGSAFVGGDNTKVIPV